MKTLDLIYVTTGRHPETEKLICKATRSQYAHAAVRIEIEGKQRIVEAVRPAVRMAPGNAFNDCAIMQVISIPITEEQRLSVVERAFELVGKDYGEDDCIIGGAKDVFGDEVADFLNRHIDKQDSYNCSGTQTELVRAAFPDYALGHDVSKITPEQGRILALDLQGRLSRGEI